MFPDLGSSQQQAALIVGFFLPLILAIPIQTNWKPFAKTLFSVGAYAAAGAVVALAAGQLNGKTFWQSTLLVLTLGVVGYQGVWKPTKIADGIEKQTNFGSPTPADTSEASAPASATATSPPPNGGGLAPEVKTLMLAGERLLHAAATALGTPAEPEPVLQESEHATPLPHEPEAEALAEAINGDREAPPTVGGNSPSAWIRTGPGRGGFRGPR
jgi:hypothetical protein